MRVRAPRKHQAASGMKSFAVTSPPLTSAMRARSGQSGLNFSASIRETVAGVQPSIVASSTCFSLFCSRQVFSFMSRNVREA